MSRKKVKKGDLLDFTHPRCNTSIIARMSKKKTLAEKALSSDYKIRMAVALNPKTSIETRERLSTDIHPTVRQSVARSIFTPEKLLLKLTKDKDLVVAKEAEKTIKEMAKDMEEEGLDNDPA